MEITWDVEPVFTLFGVSLRYYTVWFAAVFLFGYGPVRWQLRRGGGDAADVDYLVIGALVGVLLGGRVFHLLFYQTADWLADPTLVFDFSRGGLASHGSVVGLVLAIWAVSRLRGYGFIDLCDRMTFASMISAPCVRMGNFFNSAIVGRPTDQTWGIRFPRHDGLDAPLRHPSQLYEAALGLCVLGVLLLIDRRLGEDRPRGLLLSVTFMLYFGGRFLLEFFKEYQALSADDFFTMGQWLSAAPALAGALATILIYRSWRIGQAE